MPVFRAFWLALLLAAAGPIEARRPQPPPTQARDSKPPAGLISGRVVSAEGAPIRRARVAISSVRVTTATGTDPQGRYEFSNLPAGRYTIAASKPGYLRAEYGQRRPGEPGRPVELADGERLDGLDLRLPRGGAITGWILDEFGDPLAEAAVNAMQFKYADGQRRLVVMASARTNDLGQYRLYGLRPGTYFVSGRLPAMPLGPGDTFAYAPTYYPNAPSLGEAQRVPVGAGEEVGNIDVSLVAARSGRVTGRVIDSRGNPVPGGTISLSQRFSTADAGVASYDGPDATLRPDGSFVIVQVPPGQYTLEFSGAGAQAEYGALSIVVDGDLDGVTLTTSRAARATGWVNFEGGPRPDPKNIRVLARSMSSEVVPAVLSAGVGYDPRFEITGWWGPRLVRVAGLPSGWSLKKVLYLGHDVTDTPLEPPRGADLMGIQIVLTTRSTAVSGVARDDRDRPLADYLVLVFADDRARWGGDSRFVRLARPDQTGRYRIGWLPPGDYLAAALEYADSDEAGDPEFLEKLRPLATKFSLSEGESVTIDLRMSERP